MTPPSHQITVALFNVLSADLQLQSLLPDGIWLAYALAHGPTDPPRTRFGIIDLVPNISIDVAVFGGRGFEEHQYLVKAVTRDLSPAAANQASDRMNKLLEDVPIPVTGYTWMGINRLWPIEAVQPDENDPQLAWQHRGGYYKVQYAVA